MKRAKETDHIFFDRSQNNFTKAVMVGIQQAFTHLDHFAPSDMVEAGAVVELHLMKTQACHIGSQSPHNQQQADNMQ